MSAPSDGARADARKRLAESIGRLEGRGNWYTDAELAGVIADAKAEAWDERDRARATYPDPHPEDCAGWEDCWCASYPNPYREAKS